MVLNDEHVAWADDHGVIHQGIVIALTDDELWAEVREMDQDDIVQLPTSLLHPIDELARLRSFEQLSGVTNVATCVDRSVT